MIICDDCPSKDACSQAGLCLKDMQPQQGLQVRQEEPPVLYAPYLVIVPDTDKHRDLIKKMYDGPWHPGRVVFLTPDEMMLLTEIITWPNRPHTA